MIEPLIGGCRRAVDTVSRRDRRDENVGAAKFDVDPPGATDDHATEDIFKPGCRRLRIRTAQMNMVPGHDRHRLSPLAVFLPLHAMRWPWHAAINLAAGIPHGQASSIEEQQRNRTSRQSF